MTKGTVLDCRQEKAGAPMTARSFFFLVWQGIRDPGQTQEKDVG